ncbi:hypothetical protein JCGZ_26909 [Jatropha curcas]|uniref:Histone H2A n=2 Tax=Jatropha curcas TaxID=180498 RepID=A0A067L0B2_JATCU|nr:hypothetical protein JCGZ_26909 [Jatropha curcas]
MVRYLKKGRYAGRIGVGAGVYMAGVLEYLCAEMLELAGNAACHSKKSRISPRHLMLALKMDDELDKLIGNVTISSGGVLPHIHNALMSKKNMEALSTSSNEP